MNKSYITFYFLLFLSFAITGNVFSQTTDLPFKGGSHGGYTNGSKVNNNCSVNSGYNFFTSGFGGGFAHKLMSNVICETAIQFSPFHGGAIQGLFNSRLNNNSTCKVEASLEIGRAHV